MPRVRVAARRKAVARASVCAEAERARRPRAEWESARRVDRMVEGSLAGGAGSVWLFCAAAAERRSRNTEFLRLATPASKERLAGDPGAAQDDGFRRCAAWDDGFKSQSVGFAGCSPMME